MATVFLVFGCVFFAVFWVCFFQGQTADRRGRSPSFKRGALILTLAELLTTATCILLFVQAQPSEAAALQTPPIGLFAP